MHRRETYTSASADYDRVVSDPTLTVEARVPDALKPAVADKLALAKSEDVAGRITREDATLWGATGSPPTPPEIADRLGWLTIAERTLGDLDELTAQPRQRIAARR